MRPHVSHGTPVHRTPVHGSSVGSRPVRGVSSLLLASRPFVLDEGCPGSRRLDATVGLFTSIGELEVPDRPPALREPRVRLARALAVAVPQRGELPPPRPPPTGPRRAGPPAARGRGPRSPARPASADGTPPATAPHPQALGQRPFGTLSRSVRSARASRRRGPRPSACGTAGRARPPPARRRVLPLLVVEEHEPAHRDLPHRGRIHGRASGWSRCQRSWSAAAWPRTTAGSTASSTLAGNMPPAPPGPASSAAGSATGETHTTPSSSVTNASPLSCTGTATGGVDSKSASERRSSSWAVGSSSRCA